jgi:hypothetical protein
MDPQFNAVDSNSLESVGRRKRVHKILHSSVTYPQKRITGQEKKVSPDPTTSPKRRTKKVAKKYVKVKTAVRK